MPIPLLAIAAAGYIASRAAKGAADERAKKNQYTLQRDELAQRGNTADMTALLNALNQNEQAKQSRAQLGVNAPNARAKQALLGSLMANAQTTKYQPPPGVRMGSGGIDLSSLLSGARTAGRDLSAQATKAIQTGSDVPAYTDATSQLTKNPTPTQYQGAGKVETILSLLGLLGSGVGAYNSMAGGAGAGGAAGGGSGM